MEELKQYLEIQPKARERSGKDRGIVNVLLRRYTSLESIDKKILVDFVKEHNSMDRAWRQLLEHNPHLRGADYNEGKKLSQEKQISLGYTPGYNQDLQLGRKYSQLSTEDEADELRYNISTNSIWPRLGNDS